MLIYSILRIFDPTKKKHLEFNRNQYLQNSVKDKSILHVGCTDHPITEERIKNNDLLHMKLRDMASDITGIDLSIESIKILQQYNIENIIKMNAEEMKFDRKFDMIIAGDVLEHMNNPGKFLEKAYQYLNKNGELIIGVPSALTVNNVKTWLTGRELVHSDHTFYFSPKTLSCLCKRYNFLPVKLLFTVQPQTENESGFFIKVRKIILSMFNSMAPSIIMHFKKEEDVDKTHYIEWK